VAAGFTSTVMAPETEHEAGTETKILHVYCIMKPRVKRDAKFEITLN